MRATEIETFQRQSVILPNSNLINNAVGNWTHRNKLGRVDIKVGVAYGSDVKQVHAILLEIARSHPLVLKNPEPFVLFANFGAAALEFEIRVFLADVMNGNIVQNDIRFAVLDAFEPRAHRDPVDAARRRRGHKPEAWPTDDDKIEADFAEQEQAKAEAAAEAKRLAKSGRKVRKPPIKPEAPDSTASQLWHECGIQLRFSFASPISSHAKGENALRNATEAVETPILQMWKSLVAAVALARRGRLGLRRQRGQHGRRDPHADRDRRRQQDRSWRWPPAKPSNSARTAASSPCPMATSRR